MASLYSNVVCKIEVESLFEGKFIVNVCIVCIDCKTDVVWCRDGTAPPCMRQKSAYVGFW